MLVSLKWLKDYVDVSLSPGELAERLTMAGLEVEAVEEKRPAFTGVVTARIVAIQPHPNAEKLSLCQVTTGDVTYPIVCGAKNIRAGQVVPLATVGATIPGGYTIKSSRLRGEASEGMLCSEEELGIGSDNTGIMILPADLDLGRELWQVLDLADTTLDIGVTPNRSDCLSIIGIAREVAAITGEALKVPTFAVRENDEDLHNLTAVEIQDPDLCPRYTARMIKNIKIMPSPFWMRQRLEAVGLRGINNIVDVTNFVMMEMGQPLHAFDFRFLAEGRIVVRSAREGEPFISLDEKERLLRTGTLMICDGVKPVAIAGIMGGLNSEVKDDTEVVLLESAYFNPSAIRRAARWLGMGTDAAFRFERGVDPGGVLKALNRAAQLMADLSGGQVCKNWIDQYPKKIEPVRDIPLRVHRVNALLGTEIAPSEMTKLLRSLEMTVVEGDDGTQRVTPPTCRVDIEREIDLVEEIARLHGYDRIPATIPAIASTPPAAERAEILFDKIRQVLNGYGYSEVINYSFIPAAAVDVLRLAADDKRRSLVRIKNPLTEDQAVLRTTIAYSLLDIMGKNIHAGCPNLKVFEIGKTFLGRREGELPDEEERLGILLTGARYEDLWHFADLQADFYDLKGCLEGLMEALRIASWTCTPASSQPFLHPGRSCDIIVDGRTAGFLGEVHPQVQTALDLRNRALILELEMSALTGGALEAPAYRDIPRFPASSRDVAFLIEEATTGETLLQIAREGSEELLEKIYIFDVYGGKGVPAGMKSLGLRFSYRSPERTLTDEDVNRIHSLIVERVMARTGAKIRGIN